MRAPCIAGDTATDEGRRNIEAVIWLANNAAALIDAAERLAERKSWHRVVVDCEKVFELEGTAESPIMSNLANVCRDKVIKIIDLERQLAAANAEIKRLKTLLHRAVCFCDDETLAGGKMVADIRAEIGSILDQRKEQR